MPSDTSPVTRTSAAAGGPRLVLLDLAPQSPAGLLTFDAWSVLREADQVLTTPELDEGWQAALASADVRPDVVDELSTDALAHLLTERAASRSVVWFDPHRTADLTRLRAERLAADPDGPPPLEIVLGAWHQPGAAVLELVEVMDRLRSPGGCPWDAEQTHESLVPYVLEEAYEVAEAIEHGTRDDLVEELGDLLLQVVFHARVAEEGLDEDRTGAFGLDEVAAGITAKLRRRHPHVFADVQADTAEQVSLNWEEIKQAEKGRASSFDGVGENLPALTRAQKVLGRYRKADLPVPDVAALCDGSPAGELGAAVLALVDVAAGAGIDLESAVRESVRLLAAHGRDLEAGAALETT